MVNLFYLGVNPEAAVAGYPDKHVVKMGLEAVQIAWTCVRLFNDDSMASAFEAAHPSLKAMKSLGQSKHPVVVWAGLCRENLRMTLRYALAIFGEYERRYRHGPHSRKPDAVWLMANIDLVAFGSDKHTAWTKEMKAWALSGKSDKMDAAWWAVHSIPPGADAATYPHMTPPTQCMPAEFQVPGDAPTAFRNYLVSKFATMKMTFYHSDPPDWLPADIKAALVLARTKRSTPGKKRKLAGAQKDRPRPPKKQAI